ncbi:MAG: hypothetical protein MUF22_08235 [Chitinispirillaceae bacterium]|jgi:hypothetical protein|nr:hypothetical protein [Chitinispirillaceae bacterium]
MNSTDVDPVALFFAEEIIPAVRKLNARRVEFVEISLEDDSASWYRPFTAQPCLERLDGKALAVRLQELWHDVPELVALTTKLAQLAETQKARVEQSAEVSPFIYVMF